MQSMQAAQGAYPASRCDAGGLLVGKDPFDAFTRMDGGRGVNRENIGADVDGEHEFRAAKHHGLDFLLGKFCDQSLELALAVANDPAGGELFEDDAIDFLHPNIVNRHERYAARLEAPTDMVLEHREARAEKGNAPATVGGEAVGRRIGNMQHGDADFG